jgi:16S rRNA (guanine527-N7)-methyltransferase
LSGAAEPSAPELSEQARERLAPVVALLASDPTAPSSARAPEEAWRVHVADSLSGLVVPEFAAARRIADVGAGAGFPGLVLAAALSDANVDLIESTGRKCAFMRRALEASEISNARVVCERAETWATAPPPSGGREAYDVVTARAVGRLATLAELASPLLRADGLLVAWKGRRDPDEEAELDRAAERLGLGPERILEVGPFAGSRHRHLHTMRKTGATPGELPRRPGMAKKRPFGTQTAR